MASEFIDYVLLDYIDKGIPFRGQEFYLTTDTSKMLFALTMKRFCWCCGKPNSDIAHVEAVGAGRNRKKIDHTQHHFMCLCRTHHQEQHTMKMDSFLNKYHIKPIRLSKENLIELGVINKKENENGYK